MHEQMAKEAAFRGTGIEMTVRSVLFGLRSYKMGLSQKELDAIEADNKYEGTSSERDVITLVAEVRALKSRLGAKLVCSCGRALGVPFCAVCDNDD